MLPLGMILTWAGYGVATWGFVLVKGYNITLRQWFSPLHPYTGDLSKAGPVPPGQIFPGKGGQAPQAGAAGPPTPGKKSLGSGVPGSLPGAHGGGGAPGP